MEVCGGEVAHAGPTDPCSRKPLDSVSNNSRSSALQTPSFGKPFGRDFFRFTLSSFNGGRPAAVGGNENSKSPLDTSKPLEEPTTEFIAPTPVINNQVGTAKIVSSLEKKKDILFGCIGHLAASASATAEDVFARKSKAATPLSRQPEEPAAAEGIFAPKSKLAKSPPRMLQAAGQAGKAATAEDAFAHKPKLAASPSLQAEQAATAEDVFSRKSKLAASPPRVLCDTRSSSTETTKTNVAITAPTQLSGKCVVTTFSEAAIATASTFTAVPEGVKDTPTMAYFASKAMSTTKGEPPHHPPRRRFVLAPKHLETTTATAATTGDASSVLASSSLSSSSSSSSSFDFVASSTAAPVRGSTFGVKEQEDEDGEENAEGGGEYSDSDGGDKACGDVGVVSSDRSSRSQGSDDLAVAAAVASAVASALEEERVKQGVAVALLETERNHFALRALERHQCVIAGLVAKDERIELSRAQRTKALVLSTQRTAAAFPSSSTPLQSEAKKSTSVVVAEVVCAFLEVGRSVGMFRKFEADGTAEEDKKKNQRRGDAEQGGEKATSCDDDDDDDDASSSSSSEEEEDEESAEIVGCGFSQEEEEEEEEEEGGGGGGRDGRGRKEKASEREKGHKQKTAAEINVSATSSASSSPAAAAASPAASRAAAEGVETDGGGSGVVETARNTAKKAKKAAAAAAPVLPREKEDGAWKEAQGNGETGTSSVSKAKAQKTADCTTGKVAKEKKKRKHRDEEAAGAKGQPSSPGRDCKGVPSQPTAAAAAAAAAGIEGAVVTGDGNSSDGEVLSANKRAKRKKSALSAVEKEAKGCSGGVATAEVVQDAPSKGGDASGGTTAQEGKVRNESAHDGRAAEKTATGKAACVNALDDLSLPARSSAAAKKEGRVLKQQKQHARAKTSLVFDKEDQEVVGEEEEEEDKEAERASQSAAEGGQVCGETKKTEVTLPAKRQEPAADSEVEGFEEGGGGGEESHPRRRRLNTKSTLNQRTAAPNTAAAPVAPQTTNTALTTAAAAASLSASGACVAASRPRTNLAMTKERNLSLFSAFADGAAFSVRPKLLPRQALQMAKNKYSLQNKK